MIRKTKERKLAQESADERGPSRKKKQIYDVSSWLLSNEADGHKKRKTDGNAQTNEPTMPLPHSSSKETADGLKKRKTDGNAQTDEPTMPLPHSSSKETADGLKKRKTDGNAQTNKPTMPLPHSSSKETNSTCSSSSKSKHKSRSRSESTGPKITTQKSSEEIPIATSRENVEKNLPHKVSASHSSKPSTVDLIGTNSSVGTKPMDNPSACPAPLETHDCACKMVPPISDPSLARYLCLKSCSDEKKRVSSTTGLQQSNEATQPPVQRRVVDQTLVDSSLVEDLPLNSNRELNKLNKNLKEEEFENKFFATFVEEKLKKALAYPNYTARRVMENLISMKKAGQFTWDGKPRNGIKKLPFKQTRLCKLMFDITQYLHHPNNIDKDGVAYSVGQWFSQQARKSEKQTSTASEVAEVEILSSSESENGSDSSSSDSSGSGTGSGTGSHRSSHKSTPRDGSERSDSSSDSSGSGTGSHRSSHKSTPRDGSEQRTPPTDQSKENSSTHDDAGSPVAPE
nr:PREDICTED: uncharacterized protein LOC109034561 [Bemisia tabaci]